MIVIRRNGLARRRLAHCRLAHRRRLAHRLFICGHLAHHHCESYISIVLPCEVGLFHHTVALRLPRVMLVTARRSPSLASRSDVTLRLQLVVGLSQLVFGCELSGTRGDACGSPQLIMIFIAFCSLWRVL
ncbi:unnamed protein product [Microthlaspi erraticum]|uniref:Uncharacterized protein n=1 Tax=Microthlaspi erraticum TaxID=1685480 RepID=A0A6D2KIW9_9BRAS|nr:unnamed protein product [Microthlaspi erraticum]